MQITRPVMGGADDEQQDYLVSSFSLEPGENASSRPGQGVTSPAAALVSKSDARVLSSNPGAAQNFHFPVTADENGFVSLDFDRAAKSRKVSSYDEDFEIAMAQLTHWRRQGAK